MKRQRNRKLMRFVAPMIMTALLCITLPGLTKFATAALPNLQSVASLDQQARSSYSNQNFSDAIKFFQQAAQGYKTAGNPIQQALSLSNLSLAYQQLGQWKEANQAIEESLSILKSIPEKTPGKALALAQAMALLHE
jgi:tetratricopeptide (TPR) repeat protein